MTRHDKAYARRAAIRRLAALAAASLTFRVPAGTEMTASPISSAAGRSAALAGIGFMLVAVFLFGLNSAVGKWLVAKYPVGEFLLMRSAVDAGAAQPVHLARRTAAFAQCAAARPAGPAHRALVGRSRDVLLGGVVPAARRHDDVLSRGPDLRDGAVGAAAARACRLAALDRGAGRLRRRRDRAAAIVGELHAAGADRACRAASSTRC